MPARSGRRCPRAIAQHPDYRNDARARLQRASTFLAATTYGAAQDAQRAVDRVRGIHTHITGTGPDGRPYRADDPYLLRWVHVAEADSFLRRHQRYGERPLDDAGGDGYVSDIAGVATALGEPDPPRTRAELNAALHEYEPGMRATPEAFEAARFLVANPPLPLPARGPYAALAAAAITELPAGPAGSCACPGYPRDPFHCAATYPEVITPTEPLVSPHWRPFALSESATDHDRFRAEFQHRLPPESRHLANAGLQLRATAGGAPAISWHQPAAETITDPDDPGLTARPGRPGWPGDHG